MSAPGEFSQTELERASALARDPNALYAAAIGAIHLSPSIQAVLSPAGKQIFDRVYSAASTATQLTDVGATALGALGSAAISGAIEIVGPLVVAEIGNVVGAIASGVGDAIPVVNLYVGLVQVLEALPHATGSADTTVSDCADFWFARPGHSGPADPVTGTTATTPADVFASGDAPFEIDPTTNAISPIRTLRRPDSALGACLAAITECDDRPTSVAQDNALFAQGYESMDEFVRLGWHSQRSFEGLMPSELKRLLIADSMNVYMPRDHQAIYRALRHAIASNAADHGVIGWALWWDFFCADLDAGRITRSSILLTLSNKFTATAGVGITVYADICGSDAPTTMADQILALAAAWRALRDKIKFGAKPHIVVHSTPSLILQSLANPDLTDASRATWLAAAETAGVVYTLRASATLAAHRRASSKPAPPLLPHLFVKTGG